MLFANGLIDLGVAFLAAIALAEASNMRKKHETGFNMLAAGGVWMIFAGSLNVLPGYSGTLLNVFPIVEVFSVIGWIFALLGTLLIGYETFMER